MGLDSYGLIMMHMDYCDVFNQLFDSHSDGTHSLQGTQWWASDALLNLSTFKTPWNIVNSPSFTIRHEQDLIVKVIKVHLTKWSFKNGKLCIFFLFRCSIMNKDCMTYLEQGKCTQSQEQQHWGREKKQNRLISQVKEIKHNIWFIN